MAKIHISLDEGLHGKLKALATEHRFSLQEMVELSLQKVAESPELLTTPVIREEVNPSFRFIDLFAGIGGIRIAFEENGGQCVFSSEWDKYCQKTYCANFGEIPHGDITAITPQDIPDHDILCGGFPCQPFSIAGVSKKKSLGREHGFKDKAQGTLFFNVASIIESKRPKMFLLENVKNLKSHDKGNTWKVICGVLHELGYKVFSRVVDGRYYVPQHRERVFIVGFDANHFGPDIDFEFPAHPLEGPKLGSILDKNVDERYTLSDKLWNYLQQYAEKHRKKGNGFGFGLCNRNSVARTLSARYYKDGSEILIDQGKSKNPRRLTPRECARLMGYDDSFIIPVSDTQAYRQFGNSVIVPVVSHIAYEMGKALLGKKNWRHTANW
jgi:DNA (cytosine-5)-methyltransferase 1